MILGKPLIYTYNPERRTSGFSPYGYTRALSPDDRLQYQRMLLEEEAKRRAALEHYYRMTEKQEEKENYDALQQQLLAVRELEVEEEKCRRVYEKAKLRRQEAEVKLKLLQLENETWSRDDAPVSTTPANGDESLQLIRGPDGKLYLVQRNKPMNKSQEACKDFNDSYPAVRSPKNNSHLTRKNQDEDEPFLLTRGPDGRLYQIALPSRNDKERIELDDKDLPKSLRLIKKNESESTEYCDGGKHPKQEEPAVNQDAEGSFNSLLKAPAFNLIFGPNGQICVVEADNFESDNQEGSPQSKTECKENLAEDRSDDQKAKEECKNLLRSPVTKIEADKTKMEKEVSTKTTEHHGDDTHPEATDANEETVTSGGNQDNEERPTFHVLLGTDGQIYLVKDATDNQDKEENQESQSEHTRDQEEEVVGGKDKDRENGTNTLTKEIATRASLSPEELITVIPLFLSPDGETNHSSAPRNVPLKEENKLKKKGKNNRVVVTVEDASDSESEDEKHGSTWKPHRPSPGQWIEPLSV